MKYVKKPIEIDAIQWLGVNLNEARNFILSNKNPFKNHCPRIVDRRLTLKTLNGIVYVNEGDWIIKGIKGEFYPCSDEIFKETYEAVK